MDVPGVLFAGLAGAILGSFAAAASWRLPRGQDIVLARSACPACGRTLGPIDLVPVASFFWLGGRCRSCGTAISRRYPVIEAATALLCAVAAWRFGPGAEAMFALLLTTGLVILTVTDLEAGIIPDAVTLALIVLGLIRCWWHANWILPAIGAALGLGLGLGLRLVFRQARGIDALGLGDVKFFAAAGLWIGALALPVYFLLSGLLGLALALVARKAGGKIPFGPALALALYVMVLYPQMARLLG